MRALLAALVLVFPAGAAAAADVAQSHGRRDGAASQERRVVERRVVERRVVMIDEDCVGTLMDEALETPPIFRRPPPVAFSSYTREERRGPRDRDGFFYVRHERAPFGASGGLRFPGHARRVAKCGGY